MPAELDSQQRMLLWLLLVQPEAGMFLKDIQFKFRSAAQRTLLTKFGYTEETRRKPADGKGRAATYIQLLDKGWEWCQDHLQEPLPAESKGHRQVLQGLLQVLHQFFASQNHCSSLGDLVLQAQAARPQPAAELPVAAAPSAQRAQLWTRVQQACRRLTGGRQNVRIRIAELREQLADLPRSDVDSVLLEMQREGALSLWRLDNPQEVTDADRQAALVTAGGAENHILYEGGLHS